MNYTCQLCGELVGPTIADKNKHLFYRHRPQYNKAYRNGKLGSLRLFSFSPVVTTSASPVSKQPVIKYKQGVPHKRLKLFRSLIFKKRGVLIESANVCECCNESASPTWKYKDGKGEYFYLCQKCKEKIRPNQPFIKIIYTPMGGQNK